MNEEQEYLRVLDLYDVTEPHYSIGDALKTTVKVKYVDWFRWLVANEVHYERFRAIRARKRRQMRGIYNDGRS